MAHRFFIAQHVIFLKFEYQLFFSKSNLRTTGLPFAGCWFAKSWEHMFSQLSVAVFDIYRASGCISSKREASKFLCVTLHIPLA